jgi:hypothetical protein
MDRTAPPLRIITSRTPKWLAVIQPSDYDRQDVVNRLDPAYLGATSSRCETKCNLKVNHNRRFVFNLLLAPAHQLSRVNYRERR